MSEQQAVGEDVDVELGEDGQIASIETEDGSLEMNAGGEVSDERASDVSLFDDGVVTASQVATSDGQTIVSLDHGTDMGAKDVVDALITTYESAGFTTTATVSAASGTGEPTVVTLGVVYPTTA